MVVRIRQQGGGPPVEIDITVDASAVFNKDVAITATSDMDFGTIEFNGTPGGGDFANMGTNGNIGYAGNFTGSGSGSPGGLTLAGVPNGTSLQVFCSQAATLSNGSGSSINLTDIEVAAEGSVGAYGSGSGCNGIAGSAALTFSFTAGSTDEVFVGGRLNGGTISGSLDGSFSTANGGGTPIEVSVVIP